MYAYRKLEKTLEEKHWKDVKKRIVAENVAFDDCKICLFKAKAIETDKERERERERERE